MSPASTSRRVLCLFPRYEKSFGTFDNAYPLLGVKAFMPPQGLLVIAAYLPKHGHVRFIDENVRPASDVDYRWADVVMTSGMHIQRKQINEINRRAHSFGKVTAIGGPSVSGCPEHYPEFDYVHIGELGDATDALIHALQVSVARPLQQVRLQTNDRLPLSEFPAPAYEKASMDQYFLANVQFSSGCPYRCEFCDIPELYGRNPRLKTPEQILKELDAIVAGGCVGAVYFVDDNFVGNRKAALEFLPHLVEWQKKNNYPVEFACEATLNIVKSPDLLALMREAAFWTIFVGIETPDPNALHLISKDHNNTVPVLDAIKTLNSYGIEVVSGIIMGLDTDQPDTGERILHFIEQSQIPVLTINLLEALPRTPLYRRLQAAGRLNETPGRESNVEFLLPYNEVVAMWRRTFQRAFTPEAIYARFAFQQKHTYPNRIQPPASGKVNLSNLVRGITTLAKLMWTVGVRSDYRSVFWNMARPALRHLDVEDIVHVSLVSHHLISFAREAARGQQKAAFYSPELKARTA